MKKLLFLVSIFTTFTLLSGCSKTKKIPLSESDTTKISSTDIRSEDVVVSNSEKTIDTEANGKISPVVEGEVVDTFEKFDKLDNSDKASLIFNYLIKATTAIGNGESGAKELLKEKGYEAQNISELLPELENLRNNNPNDDFNQIMIKLVEFVLTKESE